VRRLARFAIVAVVVIGLSALALGLLFAAPGDHRAIRVSALAAVAVQLVAFAVVALARPGSTFAAWGVGMLLRLGALAVMGFLGLKALALPAPAAMISLVTFLFLTTLVEPLLLKT
jgi:hypothetical protein